MSFSTDMAGLLANQLSRFVTLNPHQLAGQVANLDFWLAQMRHAAATLDGYGVRFVKMHAAQEQYVAAHDITVTTVGPAYPIEHKPHPPRRIPDRELRKAKSELIEAATRFLDRCRREGLLSERQTTAALESIGVESV